MIHNNKGTINVKNIKIKNILLHFLYMRDKQDETMTFNIYIYQYINLNSFLFELLITTFIPSYVFTTTFFQSS